MTNLRQVYFNGQLVGEVPNTGDHEVDLAASEKLLRDRGLLRGVTPAQATFQQAYSFAKLSSQIYREHLTKVPRGGFAVAPFIVNSAFAIELYLKTIAQLHGSALRGHDLLELYDALPSSALAEIERTLSEVVTSDIKDIIDFRAALGKMRSTFVEWRYVHEGGEVSEVHFPSLILLLQILHDTYRHRDETRTNRA